MSYIIISQFSSFLRMFIDNPLESLIPKDAMTMDGMMILVFVIQYWPIIMHKLTYGIVGGAYRSGELPALGSLLYLLVCVANHKLLGWLVSLLGMFGLYVVIVPFMIICLIEFTLMCVIREKLFPSPSICRFI